MRLLDIYIRRNWPAESRVRSSGCRSAPDILKVYDRPLTSQIIKPKTAVDAGRNGETQGPQEASGGVDLLQGRRDVFELETSSIDARLDQCLRALDKAEQEQGTRRCTW